MHNWVQTMHLTCIRQWDSLSPYVFICCVEVFIQMVESTFGQNKLKASGLVPQLLPYLTFVLLTILSYSVRQLRARRMRCAPFSINMLGPQAKSLIWRNLLWSSVRIPHWVSFRRSNIASLSKWWIDLICIWFSRYGKFQSCPFSEASMADYHFSGASSV